MSIWQCFQVSSTAAVRKKLCNPARDAQGGRCLYHIVLGAGSRLSLRRTPEMSTEKGEEEWSKKSTREKAEACQERSPHTQGGCSDGLPIIICLCFLQNPHWEIYMSHAKICFQPCASRGDWEQAVWLKSLGNLQHYPFPRTLGKQGWAHSVICQSCLLSYSAH